ncbi:DinB family protein [Pedobacter sp. PAMC26386]|nr:DinB family protein [Pedobacter sp. PAMC26386]
MKTVSSRMESIIVLYDMYTTFFPKVIDGFTEKDAKKRLNTKANHVAWLTGSLVEERHELTSILGNKQQQTAHEIFKDHKGIQDEITYPSLDSFKHDWIKISPTLKNILLNITDEELDTPFEMMPGQTFSIYELITFTTYREASCIGQIALWRRLLGYPAMKYD